MKRKRSKIEKDIEENKRVRKKLKLELKENVEYQNEIKEHFLETLLRYYVKDKDKINNIKKIKNNIKECRISGSREPFIENNGAGIDCIYHYETKINFTFKVMKYNFKIVFSIEDGDGGYCVWDNMDIKDSDVKMFYEILKDNVGDLFREGFGIKYIPRPRNWS